MADQINVTDRDSLELLYGISREFAAALDLRTVLHRVLFLSMKNVGAVSGSIIVLDELGLPIETAFLMRGQPHDQTTLQLRTTYEHGLAGWVARNRQDVLIPDTSRDERWMQRPDDALDRTGPKSAVSAPILAREQLVGVVTLVHPEVGFFTATHLALIRAIADQAGIAILNARLYAESQRQAQVMTAVAESAAAITGSLKLDDVLQSILEQITHALSAKGCFLALINLETGDLDLRASTPRVSIEANSARIPLGKGIAGWVAHEGLGAVVVDAQKDARFVPAIDQKLGFESRSVLCAPIRSEGQVVGVLEVCDPAEGVFESDDLLVLIGIGGMAGTAIRHAQLFESMQLVHKRYHDLFEDSIDPILISDWRGRILEANHQAELTVDMRSEQLRSLTIDSLHKMDQAKVGLGFKNLISGQTIGYESVLLTRRGRQIPVQVSVRSISSGGAAQLQWILRDISERKDLDRLREDLIAMIYHDLRSPLANIVSSLDVLGSLPPIVQDTSASSLLGIALRSTERIQRLTNSLLDMSHLEAGQELGNRQPVNVSVLIEEAVDVVSTSIRNKEIDLQLQIPDDLPKVLADGDMIRRAVINLLENAIKFTPAQGKIWIIAKLEQGFVCVIVKDSGPGIPAEARERIFDKFTRLNAADGPRGVGLGLAFCRLAVNGHGGHIWVESEVGVGSSFIFTLPVVPS